ncbi:MAG: DUF3303 domain-containing protein [Rhodomicrobium sp.]
MKYVVSWNEREESSPPEYEAAQKHLLEVFKDFKLPRGFKIDQCLVRDGKFSGYVIFETETAAVETDTLGRILHPVKDRIDDHFRSNFQLKIDPVVDMTDSVAAFVTS